MSSITHEPFNLHTKSTEVAELFKDQIKGKTILITGISPASIGEQAALSIASQGAARLILASRTPSKIEEAAKNITSKYPDVEVLTLKLDLGSLAAVREAAAEVLKYDFNIDVLINNAGIMATPYRKTPDGFESQFGTNHLGHFVFTNSILGKIPAGGRVVNVSSDAHRHGPVRYDDLGFQDGKVYDKWPAYSQSKSANVLYTIELAERVRERGICVFAVHPGSILTNLGRDLPETEVAALLAQQLELKTLDQGAATHLVAAFDPEVGRESGAYLEDGKVGLAAEWARDKEGAKKLWRISEELVGEKFEF